MSIQHVKLNSISPKQKQQLLKFFSQTLDTGSYILGSSVLSFEKSFADYIGTRYAVGVASGTDALTLALVSLGVKPKDEVILPTMTFMATASSVIHLGAKPIFVDSLPGNPNMDISQVEKKITKRTKVIIPVHLHGYPVDMKPLLKLAKKKNIGVLEDSCQSHGSTYAGKRTGTFGKVAVFSFYPSKNLGALGDGGAVTTSDSRMYKRLLTLRNHGQSKKYIHEEVGYNSRLDALQAGMLENKLSSLDRQNKLRQNHVANYQKELKNLPIHFLEELPGTETMYHNFVILTKERNNLRDYLEDNKVATGIHYPVPLHLQPALKYLRYRRGDFPHAEAYSRQTLSLPLYPELTTTDRKRVVQLIKKFFDR